MAKNDTAQLGIWVFYIGVIVAIISGLIALGSWTTWVLLIAGLVVGFLNVSDKNAVSFLIALLALSATGLALNAIPTVGDIIGRIVANLVTFVSPAGLVVSLKALWSWCKP